jgi:hypothetical protein
MARPVMMSLLAVGLVGAARPVASQIRVNPTGVSTNAMNPTTVFLTFGGLRGQRPADGTWCGAVRPAPPPARGTSCVPGTEYGRLPARTDRSQLGPGGRFTDIMAIPASVARRAYQTARTGPTGTFFYVRRFVDPAGGPDEFVAVTCRLTGGGAGVPLSLSDVRVTFEGGSAVHVGALGQPPPPFAATIQFNGSGPLRGRWEVVLPGEELPTAEDLRTEGSLAAEDRGRQRRYAQVGRFIVQLTPTGRVVLPGPDPALLPRDVEGTYLVLLRIEVADEKWGDSDLGAVGAGEGVLRSGAVAAFPMPVLRYVVGVDAGSLDADGVPGLRLLAPGEGSLVVADPLPTFRWRPIAGASGYQIDVERLDGRAVVRARVATARTIYALPPVLPAGSDTLTLRWRVRALDVGGGTLRRSAWRTVRVGPRAVPGSAGG